MSLAVEVAELRRAGRFGDNKIDSIRFSIAASAGFTCRTIVVVLPISLSLYDTCLVWRISLEKKRILCIVFILTVSPAACFTVEFNFTVERRSVADLFATFQVSISKLDEFRFGHVNRFESRIAHL